MNGLKVLSLFDGISCGMVALERAGIPVARYVAYEIDKNAIKISKKNYPQIEHRGDVTTADFNEFKEFDLLIGGSPCQSLSIIQSKTREKLEGKSKLFFEYVRALRQAKPKWFLFENVASMDEESEETISRLLGRYSIEIDSANFSAQERPRLYWTNIPVDSNRIKPNGEVLRDIMQKDVPEKYFYNFPLVDIDFGKQVCAEMDCKNLQMHRRVFNPDFKCRTLTAVCGGGNRRKYMIGAERENSLLLNMKDFKPCRTITRREFRTEQDIRQLETDGRSMLSVFFYET